MTTQYIYPALSDKKVIRARLSYFSGLTSNVLVSALRIAGNSALGKIDTGSLAIVSSIKYTQYVTRGVNRIMRRKGTDALMQGLHGVCIRACVIGQ